MATQIGSSTCATKLRLTAQLQQPSRQQLVLTIHDICTELGVANSHDTSVFVKQSRLEERKIQLKCHLDNLASLMREVKINRNEVQER